MVPSRGYLAVSGDTVGHHTWEEVLLAPSGEGYEMLLNILPCTGQPHSVEWSSLNVSSAEVERPGSPNLPGPSQRPPMVLGASP